MLLSEHTIPARTKPHKKKFPLEGAASRAGRSRLLQGKAGMRWNQRAQAGNPLWWGAPELPTPVPHWGGGAGAAGEVGLALSHLLPDVSVEGIRTVWKDWKAPLKVI